MNNKDPFNSPFIVCKHNINIDSIDSFGSELSKKMSLNIELYDIQGFYCKTILNNFSETVKLFKRKSTLIPEIKYELNLKDFTLVFFDDFIEIVNVIEVDYFHMYGLNKSHELKNIFYFNNLLNQLKIIGIKEVYFSILEEFENESNYKYCFKNVIETIFRSNNHFMINID